MHTVTVRCTVPLCEARQRRRGLATLTPVLDSIHQLPLALVPKIVAATPTVNPSTDLVCCFDVSKHSLSLYTEYDAGPSVRRVEDTIPNQTDRIEALLRCLDRLAKEVDLNGVRVCAEATGGYERKLLHTARQLGHPTALISPEHVAKLKAVESNDTGKTDHKDRWAMQGSVALCTCPHLWPCDATATSAPSTRSC